jgi:ribonuclease R
MDWKKVKFMQERVGEDFDAMILSVTKYGCFVELDNLFIEGLAPIATLAGDNFTFRENTRQILGEHSGRRYSIGDRVRVILDRVNVMERRLQFSILEGEPLHLPRAAKKSTKTKAAARKEAKRKAHGYVPPPKKALGKAKRRGKNGKKRR